MSQNAAKKRLFITPDRCIGCRSCEIACAFAHATALGQPGLPRIRAYSMTPEFHVTVVCLQCENAACVQVCPTTALVRSDETGAIEVLTDRCIGCGMCLVACPFGNIHQEDAPRVKDGTHPHGTIVKCDLCEGDPACAKFCPTAALEWATESTKNPPPKPVHTRANAPLPFSI